MPRTVVVVALALLALPAAGREGADFPNPYFEKTEWKVWRLDEVPVENVQSMVRKEGKKQVVRTILQAPDERLYPADPGPGLPAGKYMDYRPLPEPSGEFAGIWDDVYTSWSGLHGYVRNRWTDADGNAAVVRDHIIHFVDVTKQNTLRAGVNFIHQSTTGMGHAIANGYIPKRTEQFERLYFADVLVTAPAHASYDDRNLARTSDLYLALFPQIFNSVGSSNSETMAITKMILAGGYLPPETKLELKRHGLYPSAMLWLWKSSLPLDVPYEHELRHRIAYKAVGDRSAYPERYGAAGIERGDLSLVYHRYDDAAHMRNMVDRARNLDVPPPEAVIDVLGVEGGSRVFALKKSVLVLQEPGQDVVLRVSPEESYDLSGRPLEHRFRLLYGNRRTTVKREGDGPVRKITVPWDDALPEGRTTIALFVSNGVTGGNPAAINVFRKYGELPGNGQGPGDYRYPAKRANRRPTILGLTDRVVEPGGRVEIEIAAHDPEGFPVRFAKRAGEPGEIDGNRFVWDCPEDAAPGTHEVHLIASDGTSGNSYAGEAVRLEVAPKVFAKLTADRTIGPAPLEVTVSAEGSFDRAGKIERGWDLYPPNLKRKAPDFEAMRHEPKLTHTFEKPGTYEIRLTVKGESGTDTETIRVVATDGKPEARPAAIEVVGSGVLLRGGDAEPSRFDGTDFGPVKGGDGALREYTIVNRGDAPLAIAGAVSIEGTEFTLARPPRAEIGPRGSTRFAIRFSPVGAGVRSARVTIPAKTGAFTFRVRGTGDVDQAAVDRAAADDWAEARKLVEEEDWSAAEAALRAFVETHPGATAVGEARALLERIAADPAIRDAIAKAEAEKASAAEAAKRERKARSLWNLAENFRKNGMEAKAKEYLERLLEEYPETSWAEKARKALGR